MKKLIDTLTARYQGIMLERDNSPEWAVHKRNNPNELVSCTIPFIGKEYQNQHKKILVYASAENLSKYYPGNTKDWEGDWLDDDEQAINRHRRCFECENSQDDSFFPHVHLQPMNNGYLATVIYYISNKLFNINYTSPREFYETISFGNYGKYSKESDFQKNIRSNGVYDGNKRNHDYAKNKSLLEFSHDFISADIEILKPDYIIIPKTIYNTDKTFIENIAGSAQIIKICQINAGVINRTIARNNPSYDEDALCKTVKNWCENIRGINKYNYRTIFTYIDNQLKDDNII